MTARSEIVVAAKECLGVRFRSRGRDMQGLDCAGLLVMVCKRLGIPYEDTTDYKRVPDAEVFRDMLLQQTRAGGMDHLRDGSILLLRQAWFPCHCGIVSMTGERCPMIVHASMPGRKVVAEPVAKFSSDISYVREFPGVI